MTPGQAISLINQFVATNGFGAISGATLNKVLLALVTLVPGQGAPLTAAVLQALENMSPGAVAQLEQAVPPEPGNLINIHFNHVPYMSANGVLYSFIQVVFPGIDMPSLYATAQQISVSV